MGDNKDKARAKSRGRTLRRPQVHAPSRRGNRGWRTIHSRMLQGSVAGRCEKSHNWRDMPEPFSGGSGRWSFIIILATKGKARQGAAFRAVPA